MVNIISISITPEVEAVPADGKGIVCRMMLMKGHKSPTDTQGSCMAFVLRDAEDFYE